MPVFFGGRLLVTPTTASVVNDDAMQNQNPGVGNAVVFIGKAQGGKPKSFLSFGSPDEAREMLRGGDLMKAVIKAFDPSAQTSAPSAVYAVNVSNATQSQLTLVDGTGADRLLLRSANYGARDNQLVAKVESGSLSGKRLTIQYGRQLATGDNLGKNALSVTYTGAEETATITVTGTTVTLHAPAATEVASINLNDVATVGALVSQINLVSGWAAEVLDNSDDHDTLNALDALDAADATTEVVVTADTRAVFDWLRFSGQNLVEAELLDHGGTIANLPATGFAGGTDGLATVEDWQECFDLLQMQDVYWFTALSGDPAIRAMTDAHVSYCSSVLGKERRAILGTDLATSFESGKSEARSLNSDRSSLVIQGHYEFDLNGNLELRPPYMTAAIIAAMFASANPGTPMTNKSLKVRGLEFNLRNPVDTDNLINGGVLCLEDDGDAYKVVQSISTWLIDSKYTRREQSCGAALDYTVRAVREAVDVLRGQKQSPLQGSRAVSITDSTLREVARPEPEGIGAIVGDDENPAYRNIQATIEGDVTRVRFECSPAIPNNYNLVTVYARQYSGTFTAA